MEQSQLLIDLSSLIEYRINERNILSKRDPRPIGLIKIIDREVDILLKIELYIPSVEQNNARRLIEYRNKYFRMGVNSGKLEQKTGREHPISYFE